MFFYIKKPSFLDFSKKEYDNEQVKRFTVTQRAGVSNTKLIIYDDDSVYLKNGSQFFKLSESTMNKKNYVAKLEDEKLTVEENIDKKYFIHKL
ncbi:putative SP-containing protein [Vairimorpha necatrix]|uniref:SP-containing protein n=1 Tax=Vairimorpha necatrix TaxID=6039 RepID=A0AAX4JEL1_9MICR